MRLLLCLSCLFTWLAATGQTLPPERRVDWSRAGYPGSFPDAAHVINVADHGIIGDSVTDQQPAVRQLLDSLAGTRTEFYFPPGNYRFGQSLQLPDSIILRGSGADSTLFTFNLGGVAGDGLTISGGANGTWYPLTGGYELGSDRLIVNDGGAIQSGDWIELRQQNGSWDTQPISWADYSVGQILQVLNRSGDTLLCDRALRFHYEASFNPKVSTFQPAREVGLACFSILRADNVASAFCPLINFRHAVNCYVKGVDVGTSISAHLLLDASSRISVTGCYFHDSFEYDGASMHGYGIALYYHTGDCLIEDNIFRNLRHSLSFQCGANGNVVAYNYSREPNRSEFPSNYGADISMHGHYPYANLFEGNIVQNIQLDQTWGPSGPRNTFFRNRSELYGILMTSATMQSDSQAFIGNEVTNTGLLLGNYSLAGSGHFEYGNMVRGTLTPAGTANLQDSSYYLSGPPDWWTGSAWPGIGIPFATGSGSNPAFDRFALGSTITVCERTITTNSTEPELLDVRLFPNPAINKIQLRLGTATPCGKANIEVVHANGKVVLDKELSDEKLQQLELTEIPPGCYFVRVRCAAKSWSGRLILIPG